MLSVTAVGVPKPEPKVNGPDGEEIKNRAEEIATIWVIKLSSIFAISRISRCVRKVVVVG